MAAPLCAHLNHKLPIFQTRFALEEQLELCFQATRHSPTSGLVHALNISAAAGVTVNAGVPIESQCQFLSTVELKKELIQTLCL